MSRIRADKLVNRVATGAPQLTYGAEIPVGYGLTGAGNISITGVITATTLYGDGSGLTGVVGSGSGVIVRDDGSLVGTAGTINFGDNLTVSPISAGIVTVSINVLSGVQVTGIATFDQLSAANLTSVGIATLGQLSVSGVATATTFVGNLTGTASTATNAQGLTGTPNITVGIITASSLIGYDSLVGTASSTTKTFAVTVASKTSNHRYIGSGSGNAYFIDGIESPFLTLLPGKTYRFTQEDGSNSGHPLRFYYEADKTTQYSTNVTTSGTPGSAGAYTEIVVTDTTPIVLHYQCSTHGYMGNSAQFNSNVVDTSYQITTRSGLSVTGVSTFSGAIDANGDLDVGGFLSVSGVSTFASNPVLIGAATSTGTVSQSLQVTGGTYISGSVGIGTTVASSKLTVLGGDIAVGIDTSSGVILTSPNGTRYRLVVDNAGALSTTAV